MKEDYNKNLRTMNQLDMMQKNNKKFVVWNLSSKVRAQVEAKYFVEDYLYEIRTKQLKNIRTINNKKLKELHFACKQNKRTIVRELNEEDKKILSEYGIRFRPTKYKIYLNA